MILSGKSADVINGAFEFIGSFMCMLHVHKILKDRYWRGISWVPFVFFASWGFWNLFFYSSVDCWLSFYASILLCGVNTFYCYLLWRYRNN